MLRTPNLNRHLRALQQFADQLPRSAHEHFRSITPIDTGNARSRTDLRGDEIQGNYPYANRLNEGYSRQARAGMTEPTIEWVRDQIRGIR
jgi:hypothetical protein